MHVKTLHRSPGPNRTITPVSLIINILLFALFALITQFYTTVLLQLAVIGTSFFLCRLKAKDLPLRQFLPIIPIVCFVLILNCFRGTGEVLVKVGPFLVVRQGILRGVYYTAVIIQLWLMSKILTIGFGEKELLISLSSFSRKHESSGIILVLYYVLRIFHNTYRELKGVFKGSGKRIRERVIDFFMAAFEKSKSDFDRMRSFSPCQYRPLPFDFIYISLEVLVLLGSFLMRRTFIQL